MTEERRNNDGRTTEGRRKNEHVHCEILYNKFGSIGGKTEAGIPYSRLIRIPSPFGSPKLMRERRRALITPQLTSIQEILAAGPARGQHKNWRAKELGVVEHGNRNEHF